MEQLNSVSSIEFQIADDREGSIINNLKFDGT